jgi:hypothetical protein
MSNTNKLMKIVLGAVSPMAGSGQTPHHLGNHETTVGGYASMIGIRLELDSIIFQIFAKNYNL